MRLLHPFMPFLSEEIWAKLPHEGETLSIAEWPIAGVINNTAEADFEAIQNVVRTARNLRAQADIAPSKKVNITLLCHERTDNIMGLMLEAPTYLKQLANIEEVTILGPDGVRPDNAIAEQTLSGFVEVILPLEGLIDVEKERAKLEKQLEAARKDVEKVSGKLNNPKFVERAPAEILAKDRARLAELEGQIEKLVTRLAGL